jgi:hypothetical protein
MRIGPWHINKHLPHTRTHSIENTFYIYLRNAHRALPHAFPVRAHAVSKPVARLQLHEHLEDYRIVRESLHHLTHQYELSEVSMRLPRCAGIAPSPDTNSQKSVL